MKSVEQFKKQAKNEKIVLTNTLGQIWELQGFKIVQLPENVSFWSPFNKLPVSESQFLKDLNFILKN
jgi:hypothetical protein